MLIYSICLTLSARAQLLPSGAAVPHTPKPPIVFLNGYQSSCSGSEFANTFGLFDQLFQATNRVSLFFDNCNYPGKPALELLGNDFRDYLAALKYTDGSSVTEVDVVAHSLGGLIVRSYLAGKQTAEGVFQPPATPGIRKMVFLAVPNFGTPIANLFGIDTQVNELANGSLFTFDLNTWNQGTDDLRGIDTLEVAGNGGTGQAIQPGFDDGVVSLTSASIAFAEPGRTRIVPYCHTGPGLVTLAGYCPPNAPGIAQAVAATNPNAALTLSFLNDTSDWQSIGQPGEQNQFLSTGGGLVARAKSATDQFLTIQKAVASKTLNIQSSQVAWTELLPAQMQDLLLTTPSGTLEAKFNLPSGYVSAITVKTGPFISRVFPAAAAVAPLAVAPGEIVSIYGSNLSASQVDVNGTPATADFVGATQINAVFPDVTPGLATVTALSSAGTHTVNVMVQQAVPAIFTQDQSGSGAAAALNALTNALVTPSAPLHPGDYVSLYLTGLGATHNLGGLQVALFQPNVTVGGQTCQILFAGRAPGFPGLDQINCRISTAVTPSATAPVLVTSAGRTSNLATLAIE